MTWPTVAVATTNVDAGTDSPATARTDIKDAIDKLNQMMVHVSAFAATILDDANAAAALTTLGAPSTGEIQTQTHTAFTTGGTATAFTLTPTPAIAALATNQEWDVTFHANAGTTPTLSVSGTTAKSLKYRDAAGVPTPITSVKVPAGWRSKVTYDGTDYIVREVSTGGQYQFSATPNPSTDVNTLDDYEEGTWIPSVGGTATYSSRSGTYVKVGKVVFFNCFVGISAIGTGSQSIISGLPFSPESITPAHVSACASLATSVVFLSAYVNMSSQLELNGLATAGTSMASINAMGTGSTIRISGCYQTA